MGMRNLTRGQRRILSCPRSGDFIIGERLCDVILGQTQSSADVVDQLLLGLGLSLLYGVVDSVLKTGLAAEVFLCHGDEIFKQRVLGLALLNTGTDNVTDRGDRQNGTVLFGVDTSPVYGLRLLGRVYVVLHLGTVGISDMTEAIGGEEQRAGLLLPVVAGNTREDDLILNAFGEIVADLSSRIKLKDTGLARCSGAL